MILMKKRNQYLNLKNLPSPKPHKSSRCLSKTLLEKKVKSVKVYADTKLVNSSKLTKLCKRDKWSL